ncbi:hypothetical protein L0Y65_03290 [Candidatus Micrarchaeota archaeon]|nr:hypothetical protein [Candidatus Micrarchaeota archaeon]
MRIFMFFKMMIAALCVSLLAFALVPEVTPINAARMMALGTVMSIAIAAYYPDVRGIRAGDAVSLVNDANMPSLIGRPGTAAANGKRNERIKITLPDGNEALGVIESYVGLISPPKIRILYEEKLVE